jgi:hypothetical protein
MLKEELMIEMGANEIVIPSQYKTLFTKIRAAGETRVWV